MTLRAQSSLFPCLTLILGAACSGSGSTGSGSGSGTSTGTTSGRTSSGLSSGVSSSGTSVGAACNNIYPCAAGLTCEQVPELGSNGICTVPCASSTACPSGGTCIQILPGQDYCLQTCGSSSDCDVPAYGSCDPTCLVCVPEAALGQVGCGTNIVGGGAHNSDGGACDALPDGGALSWSPGSEVSAGPLTLAEEEAVLSSDGQGNLVAAFMVIPDAGPGDAGAPLNWMGFATSTDDGTSFTVGTPIISPSDAELYDPTLANDGMGNTYLAFAGLGASLKTGELYVVSSANNGKTWGALTDALPAEAAPLDKPYMALNPSTQLPAVIFADLANGFGGSSRIALVSQLAASDFSTPIAIDDGTVAAFRDLASLAFDQVGFGHAAWIQVEQAGQVSATQDQATGTLLAGSPANTIKYASFSATNAGVESPTGGDKLVSASGENVAVDSARVAVAADGSAVYVAYVIAGADNQSDIRLASSIDQGMTWSQVTVNDDPGCATHFHPSVFVDASATVWVSWVDNRDGFGHVFYASSTDQGKTFTPDALLSSAPFYFTTLINSVNASVPGWLGAYQFLGGTNAELFALWTADPGGTSAVDPAHVYFAKATLP